MVTLLLYPNSWSNGVGWTNPQYATGQHDGQCALSPTAGSTQTLLYLSNYRDALGALPNIAGTLDGVYIKKHSVTYLNYASDADYYRIQKAGRTASTSPNPCGGIVCGCAQAYDSPEVRVDVLLLLTIADINNENYTTWCQFFWGAVSPVGGNRGIFDHVRIRVEYTPPAPIFGDGLVWIASALKRRMPKPLHLLPFGGMLKRG